jgi:hypothetical protein
MLVLTIGSSTEAVSTTPSDTRIGADQRNTGLVMMGIGLPACLIGLYIAMTTQTRVSSSTGATFTNAEPPAPPKKHPALALTAHGLEF